MTDAVAVGPCVALLYEMILNDRPHPEQGFRACMGILKLPRSFGRERVDAACERALEIGTRTYGSVRSILDNRLDQAPARQATSGGEPIRHRNIRAPNTTTERRRYAQSSLARPPVWHGQGFCRDRSQSRGDQPDPCRMARPAALSRMDLAHDRKLATRLRFAKLRHQVAVEDVDYRSPRGLDRALFLKLVVGDWIDAHDGVIITGPTGAGKLARLRARSQGVSR